MSREEVVTQTILNFGYSKLQAMKLAKEIIRNLTAYSKVEEQRQVKMRALLDNTLKAQKKAKE